MGRGHQPVAGCGDQHVGKQPLPLQVHRRGPPAQVVGGHLSPDRSVELVSGVAEQDQRLAGLGAEAGGDPAGNVVDHTQHAHDRRGKDRGGARLVVEADVAAGDRDGKLGAAVGQTADRLGELPHHAGILRGSEIEAVSDRHRGGAGDRDVAVGLRQRQLRAGVRVELGVAARCVGGHRDTAAGLFVDAQQAAVGVLGQHRVTADVAVVLLGDERAAAQMRTAKQRKQSRAQLGTGGRALQPVRRVGVQRVLAVGARDGTLVHRALVRDGPRWHVDDRLAVPGDVQPVAVGDLPDHGGQHLPLTAHRKECIDVAGRDHRAHPLLRLAGEHLGGGHAGGPQRHLVQLDRHPAVTG